MKTLSSFFLFFLLPAFLFAGEIRMNVYHESIEGGANIFADNNEYCAVSLMISYELNNMQSSEPNNKVFVIPPRTIKFSISNLKLINPHASFKFRYTYKTNYGDITQTSFEKNFSYQLPYPKGKSYKVFQGYNGQQTHQGVNALDFSLTEGSNIAAVRDGIVVKVVQNNNVHCIQPECAKLNNYILIVHNDGTFANYAHIQQNGAKVQEGDSVLQGQIIALSGNVGRTDGPHLHLEIFLQKLDNRTSLPTFFLTGSGTKKEILKEGNSYSRDY
jgi:murein DD-endopeptidase MepM/ murein hydrolase activator NlpD